MAHKTPKNNEQFMSVCLENAIDLPFSNNTDILKTKLELSGKLLHNRIVYQAMEGCDGTASGVPGELTRRRYLRFAAGGAALIWFEATAVSGEGRANPRQMFINEENLPYFKRLVEEIKECGLKKNGFEPLIFCQLTHSGRHCKPNGKPEPLAAYNNPNFEGDTPLDKAQIVTDDYLDGVKESMIKGARLARLAGFDGADIKSCHGYLLCELLSAYNRGGRYGGSFENRTRILRESVSGAVSVCGTDFIITSRLNIYDGYAYPFGFGVKADGSLTPDYSEPVALVRELKNIGMKVINITMGNPYANPHVNRPFSAGTYEPPEHPMTGVNRMLTGAAEIKKAVDISVICSGISFLGAVSPNVSAGCIARGMFDCAGFGRQTLAYPDAAADICRLGMLDTKQLCTTCGKCSLIMRAGGTPGCVIRDSDIYLPLYKKYIGG